MNPQQNPASPEFQSGMQLRHRQLPGVVPVVPPKTTVAPSQPTTTTAQPVGVFGTVRKALGNMFSFLSQEPSQPTVGETTTMEPMSMEETIPFGSIETPVRSTSTPVSQPNLPPSLQRQQGHSLVNQPTSAYMSEPRLLAPLEATGPSSKGQGTHITMSHGIGGNQNVIQGNVGSPHMAPPPTYSSATQQTVPAGL